MCIVLISLAGYDRDGLVWAADRVLRTEGYFM